MLTDGLRFLEGSTNTNLVLPVVTETGKAALQANLGEVVFQSNGQQGLYVFNGTSWVLGVNTSSASLPVDASLLPAFSGDVESAAGTAVITLKNITTAGDYNYVTVNAKGQVTQGHKYTTLTELGITDAVVNTDARLTDARTPLAHTHVIADITDLQITLDAKAIPADITTAITNIKASVDTSGDNLKKLYDLIVAGFKEVSVANTAARDAYDVITLPTNIFVVDDGDNKWALYKAISTGTNATYIKLSDPDLLNAAIGITPENIVNKSADVTLGGVAADDDKYPSQKAVKTYADTKVTKNTDIVAGTGTKVSYDAKGLVTSSSTLVESDIPALAIAKITSLQSSLDAKATPADITTAITNIKASVETSGDNLKKLYDLIVAGFKEVTVATPLARNAYNVTSLPTNVFVTDDGDGKWALYKATTTGINATYVKLSDPDLLNAAIGITPENIVNKSTDGTLGGSSADDAKYPSQKAVKTYADTKVTKNADIVPGTGTKVTYDVHGLITSSSALAEADIPALAISKVTNLQSSLDAKLAKNTDIVAGTGTKVSYDVHGLITSSAALVESDIPALAIAKITSLQSSLDAKATPADITTAITNIKASVETSGDNLKKLYDLIVAGFKEVTVATIAARDAYNVTSLPTNIFVTDDTDGHWALYKATTTGVGATFVKLSDPDLLNAAVGFMPENATNKSTDGTLGAASADDTKYPSQKAVKTYADTKVSKNADIVAGTGTKVSYDVHGLITSSAALVEADIPALAISKVTNLQSSLDAKLAKNTAITAGTGTKITYDVNGLITSSTTLGTSDLPSNLVYTTAGKISSTLLPSMVVTNTTVVSDVAADETNIDTYVTGAIKGDIAILSNLSKTFILSSVSPNVWVELLSPTGGVISVNGLTGSSVDVSYDVIDTKSTDIVTAGTYNNVTVNAKGRITSVANTSYATLDSNNKIYATALPTFIGDVTLNTTDNTLSLASVSNVAGTYNTATTVTPLTVDGKGRISTVGTATKITPAFADITAKPTTISGYGITDAELTANKNIANGYAGLDSSIKLSTTVLPSSVVLKNANGLIDSSLLPAVTLNNTFVVSNASATASNIDTYATGAIKGDIAILTTLSKTFVLSATGPNVWVELLSPTGGVTSVNGKSGSTIVLSYTDIDGQSTDIVTAGTYNKVTVNAKGRITNVANAAYATLDSSSLLPVANLPALSGDVTTTAGSSGNVTKVAKINGITVNNATTPAAGMILSLDTGTTTATWKTAAFAALDANSRLPASNLPLFSGGDITTTSSTAALTISKLNGIPFDTAFIPAFLPNDGAALVYDATAAKVTYKAVAGKGANTFTGTQEATTFKSNVATGTAPLSITSTTVVPNLNVKLVNGITISGTPVTGSALIATGTTTAAWTAAAVMSTINTVTNRIADGDGNLRSLPVAAKTAAYSLTAADNGRNINIYNAATVSITVPAVGVFANGDLFSVYNQSAVDQNITFPAGYTVYVVGTTASKLSAAGSVAVKARGIASVMFTIPNGGTTGNATEVIISGNV